MGAPRGVGVSICGSPNLEKGVLSQYRLALGAEKATSQGAWKKAWFMATKSTKKALITGITGQDGSYLAEFLLGKGYEVHGIIRRSSTFNTQRIEHLYEDVHEEGAKLFLHYGDLSDSSRLTTLLQSVAPDEVYNLAAQSHVRVSFDEPEYTGNTTGLGSIRLLEAIRMLDLPCRFYQASSSEMFGATPPPQNEETVFYPCLLYTSDAADE